MSMIRTQSTRSPEPFDAAKEAATEMLGSLSEDLSAEEVIAMGRTIAVRLRERAARAPRAERERLQAHAQALEMPPPFSDGSAGNG